jgi:hypothetical protein
MTGAPVVSIRLSEFSGRADIAAEKLSPLSRTGDLGFVIADVSTE